MPNMMIPDAGVGGGAGSVPLVVSPDKLRSTAERFNRQLNGGAGSGYWAVRRAVENLRASAGAMTAAAVQHDAQNQATADALRANQAR